MMEYGIKTFLTYLQEEGMQFDYQGNPVFSIKGFCPISDVSGGRITWAKNREIISGIPEKALKESVIVLPYGEPDPGFAENGNFLFCDNPKRIFFALLARFYAKQPKRNIAKTAIILSRQIGEDVSIGEFCYIGEDVRIEDHVTLDHHVVIDCPALIKKNSRIHSGVVIGTDGFGYAEDGEHYEKVPHFGGVQIGENVEIGANTCIDRGTMGDTNIGNGVKIDNLCHIAHNVRIDENCLVIAQSCLGGSSILERHAYIAPGVVVKNQITVGEDSLVGMGAVVTKNVERGKIAAGVPARVMKERLGKQ